MIDREHDLAIAAQVRSSEHQSWQRLLFATPGAGSRHPYLLRGMEIVRPSQVWAMNITYIPMARGFVYLVPANIPVAL